MNNFSDTHIEQLSAYIDHRLSPAERRALESQLEQNPALRAELAELQSAVHVLRDLPPVMPPRTFTLDPALHQRRRPVFSVMRWAGAFSAFVLILAVGLGVFSSSVQNKLESPSWVGGAPSSATSAAAATSAPLSADMVLQATLAPTTGAAAAMPEAAKLDQTPAAPTDPLGSAAGGAPPESAENPGDASNPVPTATAFLRMTQAPAPLATSAPQGSNPGVAPSPSPVVGAVPNQPAAGAPVPPPQDPMPAGGAAPYLEPQVEDPLRLTVPTTDAAITPYIQEYQSSSPGTTQLSDTVARVNPVVIEDSDGFTAFGERSAAPSPGAPSLGLIFVLVALLGVSLTAIVIGWRMLRAKPKD
ncbi:MAG TPA: hypothetical protein VGE07_01395 [Herpetosiphonaceae bacterium]